MKPTNVDPLAVDTTSLSQVEVDLGQLGRNWNRLQEIAGATKLAAVVKADAYGLGLSPIVSRLLKHGCDCFFTAHLREAIRLRDLTKTATIHVLNGLVPADIPLYLSHDISPVLGSPREISDWVTHAPEKPATLHVDTGINRLGLTLTEARALAANPPEGLRLSLIMSHLACADDPRHPLNGLQISRFKDIAAAFPAIPASLANSYGLVNLPESHFDLARTGIALFGGGPALFTAHTNPGTVRFEARILQRRIITAGQSVGYGAKAVVARRSEIALVAAGYADGYPRLAEPGRAYAAINGHPVPLIGTISMDMLAIDVTELPPGLGQPGDWVELIGPSATLQSLASAAGTISYDLLTKLGPRSNWRYIN